MKTENLYERGERAIQELAETLVKKGLLKDDIFEKITKS